MSRIKKEELERETWREFLWDCDISHWRWTNPEEEDIVGETEDYWIVQVYVGDILDQPDVYWIEEDNGELIVNWGFPIMEDGDTISNLGFPVIIENPDDVPEIFIKIWKTPVHGEYHCDGQFYFSLDEIE